ncbi:hypothetical protein [Streptomyces sp. NPDC059008]|uniref:hypothetical protein n=1 Tax=Streptomyces sp. NPDC059008 TaxID=3346693 RepID=UPI0036B418C7
MTWTKKTEPTARGGRVAVIGALALASVTLAAVPAYAKGGVDITAPRTAHVGKTFTVTAQGNDDAASYLRICLEGRNGGQAWQPVTCGAVVPTGTDAQAAAHVKAVHRGVLQYRAVLYGLTSPNDGHPVRERASDLATVDVR